MMTMMISAGELTHKVNVEEKTQTKTASGDMDPTWNVIGWRHIGFVKSTAKEFMDAKQQKSELTHLVKMRYDPNLNLSPRHRFVMGDRTLNVIGVENMGERNSMLLVSCREET